MPVSVLEVDLGVLRLGQGMIRAQFDEMLDSGLFGGLEEGCELTRHVLALGDRVGRDAEDGVDVLEDFIEVEAIAIPIEHDHLGRGREVGNGMKLAGTDADLGVVVSGGEKELGDAESNRAVSVGDEDTAGLVAGNEGGEELAEHAPVGILLLLRSELAVKGALIMKRVEIIFVSFIEESLKSKILKQMQECKILHKSSLSLSLAYHCEISLGWFDLFCVLCLIESSTIDLCLLLLLVLKNESSAEAVMDTVQLHLHNESFVASARGLP